MSWELMWEKEEPCRCGLGKIVVRFEMDDWNGTRYPMTTLCDRCNHEDHLRHSEWQKKFSEKEKLFERAKALAQQRYLQKWLDSFRGCTIKGAWLKYTGGSRYPALGTFYQHVKHAGDLMTYLEWKFKSDVKQDWESLGIKDPEIENLLDRSKDIWERPLMRSRDIGRYCGG